MDLCYIGCRYKQEVVFVVVQLMQNYFMNRLRFIFECNSFSLILKRYFVLVVRGSNVDIFFFFNVVGCKLYFEIKNF